MTLNAARFIDANRLSPIEYYGSDLGGANIRLVDGSTWRLTAAQLRECAPLKFKHLEKVDA